MSPREISIPATAKLSWNCSRTLHREGATICMVTHDPRFAKHAEREVHLFDGKVVAEEELKKLMADVHA